MYYNAPSPSEIDTILACAENTTQYALSQLRFVRSGLNLVTYLIVGNFCDKSTETTLHEICVQDFRRLSDFSKPSQSVS